MAEPIEDFVWERPPQDVERSMGFVLRRYNQYIGLLRDHIEQLEKYLSFSSGELTIQSGSASITLKKDGSVKIKGTNIVIDASGSIEIKAARNVDIKGSKVNAN